MNKVLAHIKRFIGETTQAPRTKHSDVWCIQHTHFIITNTKTILPKPLDTCEWYQTNIDIHTVIDILARLFGIVLISIKWNDYFTYVANERHKLQFLINKCWEQFKFTERRTNISKTLIKIYGSNSSSISYVAVTFVVWREILY